MEEQKEAKEDVNYNSQGVEVSPEVKETSQRLETTTLRKDYANEGASRSEIGLAGESDFIERAVTAKDLIEGNMLDKFPPNLKLAKIHGNANLVKNLDQWIIEHSKIEDSKYFCPCWQRPTTEAAPMYPLWWNVMELEDLGCGFPLYFYFKMF